MPTRAERFAEIRKRSQERKATEQAAQDWEVLEGDEPIEKGSRKDRRRYCPQCAQWRGPENFGDSHPLVCWHCTRNPTVPAAERRAGVVVDWGRP